MTYTIQSYTKKQAKLYGVSVVPSHNRKHKIDVIKNGFLIASIGAIGYSDYPTYKLTHGLNYAEERRRLYKSPSERMNAGSFMKTARTEFDHLMETTPPISKYTIDQFKHSFKGKEGSDVEYVWFSIFSISNTYVIIYKS